MEIGRRQFISALGGAISAWPLAAQAQQVNRMRHVGLLMGGPSENDPGAQARFRTLRHALQELGWTEKDRMSVSRLAGRAAILSERAALQPNW